jgi:hypothetical protein
MTTGEPSLTIAPEPGGYFVIVARPDERGGIKLDNFGLVRLLAASLRQDDIDELCRTRTLPSDRLPGAERHGGDTIRHD